LPAKQPQRGDGDPDSSRCKEKNRLFSPHLNVIRFLGVSRPTSPVYFQQNNERFAMFADHIFFDLFWIVAQATRMVNFQEIPKNGQHLSNLDTPTPRKKATRKPRQTGRRNREHDPRSYPGGGHFSPTPLFTEIAPCLNSKRSDFASPFLCPLSA
jgi:hypothetical protein